MSIRQYLNVCMMERCVRELMRLYNPMSHLITLIAGINCFCCVTTGTFPNGARLAISHKEK